MSKTHQTHTRRELEKTHLYCVVDLWRITRLALVQVGLNLRSALSAVLVVNTLSHVTPLSGIGQLDINSLVWQVWR